MKKWGNIWLYYVGQSAYFDSMFVQEQPISYTNAQILFHISTIPAKPLLRGSHRITMSQYFLKAAELKNQYFAHPPPSPNLSSFFLKNHPRKRTWDFFPPYVSSRNTIKYQSAHARWELSGCEILCRTGDDHTNWYLYENFTGIHYEKFNPQKDQQTWNYDRFNVPFYILITIDIVWTVQYI